MEHDFYFLFSFFGIVYLLHRNFGPQISAALDKGVDVSIHYSFVILCSTKISISKLNNYFNYLSFEYQFTCFQSMDQLCKYNKQFPLQNYRRLINNI